MIEIRALNSCVRRILVTVWIDLKEDGWYWISPLTPELNPFGATLPDVMFYWGFCFLNPAFL
jgi:hypothetical protein